MKIVLLRHATRSTTGLGDSPLTLLGLAQAEEFGTKAATARDHLLKPTHVIASPKQRARQTLEPLAEKSGIALKIDPRLDERHQNEPAQTFTHRMREILAEVEAIEGQPEPVIYLCSHLDWLEQAVTEISTDLTELEAAASWQTCEYRIFNVEDGLWQFVRRGRAEGAQS